MSAATPREHWHQRATSLAQLDSSLLNLLPWADQALCNLPSDLYLALLKKLDELVGEACRAEARQQSRKDIEFELAKAIWNFMRPWKRAETIETTSTTGET